MIYAREIKKTVDIKEGLEYYGVRFNNRNFAICPFHQEKTPSLYVYRADGMFVCFGCGAKGDLIQFVQMYYDISFKDALNKINDDFALGLDRNNKARNKKENVRLNSAVDLADQRFKRLKAETYSAYCDELIVLRNALDKLLSIKDNTADSKEAIKLLENKIRLLEEKLEELI